MITVAWLAVIWVNVPAAYIRLHISLAIAGVLSQAAQLLAVASLSQTRISINDVLLS